MCRLSTNFTTLVQELGRLCRYPSLKQEKIWLVAGSISRVEQLQLALPKLFEEVANFQQQQAHADAADSTSVYKSFSACNVSLQQMQQTANALLPLLRPQQVRAAST